LKLARKCPKKAAYGPSFFHPQTSAGRHETITIFIFANHRTAFLRDGISGDRR
jgi:hypothetical protein